MTNPAHPDDVASLWGTIADGDALKVADLLTQAWAVLQAQSPGLEARMMTGTPNEVVVRSVVVAMVLRVLRNPQGYRQGSRTIDDFSESWTWDNTTSTGLLYATPQELALLGVPAALRGAFTIRQEAPASPFWPR